MFPWETMQKKYFISILFVLCCCYVMFEGFACFYYPFLFLIHYKKKFKISSVFYGKEERRVHKRISFYPLKWNFWFLKSIEKYFWKNV